MCGIAGIFSVERPVDAELVAAVLRMLDRQVHRGPNDWGILIPDQAQDDPAIRALLEPRGWEHVRVYPGSRTAPAAVIGSRRLSIIDLSTAGRMPFISRDNCVAVVYNGEIYNFAEVRDELRHAGHSFRSNTDTEVLLHGYQQWGEDLPRHLRGMFAFVILDARRPRAPKLFAARDRFGIKPLYWSRQGCAFQFASEVRALMAGGWVANAPEPRGINGFLVHGSVPTPWTTIRDVMSLGAAESLAVDQCSYSFPKPSRYWSLPEMATELSLPEAVAQARELLASSVREQLVSDVPLGVFLSGGMDSSALVALAASQLGRPLTTLCVTFDEQEFSEDRYARVVADCFHTNHEEVRLRAEEFIDELPRFFDALDQPTVDGMNTYFVAKAARQTGLTVVLSGVGGDELFQGYPGFRSYPLLRRLRRVPFSGRIVTLAARALQSIGAARYEKLEFLAEHPTLGPYLTIRGLFPPRRAAELLDSGRLPLWHHNDQNLADDAAQYGRLELAHYMQSQLLRDTDVFAMQHSVEVRVPFLDHRLAELTTRLPSRLLQANGATKPLLAAALGSDYPPEIVKRRKMGFTFPLVRWVSRAWNSVVANERPPRSAVSDAHFNRVASDYVRGRRHWSQPWALAVLRAAEKRGVVPPLPPADSPKRMLFILPQVYGVPGGISIYNQGLLRAVSEAFPRAELHVVSLNDSTVEPALSIRGRVHFTGSGPRGGFAYRYRMLVTLLRAVARCRPDAIVSGHINVVPFTAVLSAILRAPNMLITYGVEAWHPPAWLRTPARRVDRVFAISRYTADRLRSWGVEDERIASLPCMVDGDVFRPIRTGKENGERTLLTVARLDASEKYKGIDKVLAAVQRAQAVRSVRYVIAGTGDDMDRLKALADSLGLNGRVDFRGFVGEQDLPSLYGTADVFVMPSKKEGFGIVFIEALACGIPVVAGNQDGSLDALNAGAWGRMVDPDSVSDIFNAVVDGLPPVPDRQTVLGTYGVESFRRRVHAAMAIGH